MNGRRAREGRYRGMFVLRNERTGERICPQDHRVVCANGAPCPTCEART